MELTDRLFKGDKVVWIIFMLLCCISLVEIYSATSTLAYKQAHYYTPILRHAIFLLIGAGVVLLIQNVPYRYFSIAVILLPISILLLIITMFFGKVENNAARWLSIGPISFQPSEFAKMACVIFVAFILSRQRKIATDKIFWIIVVAVLMTCLCILKENFSTAFILGTVCFLMMLVGQMPLKKLATVISVLVILVGLTTLVLYAMPQETADKIGGRVPTWKSRIEKWFSKGGEENKYVLNDDNLQVNSAKIAIAKGGLFGRMPGNSEQRDVLPQAYSDFIYAIIIEELGLVGGIGVLLLYVFLMYRVALIARRCDKLFPKFIALGCGLLIVVQAFINMAVAVNLIPVTGQPLPLISRGGTSTILTCCYFGIILSVSRFGANIGNDVEIEEDVETEEVDSENVVEERYIEADGQQDLEEVEDGREEEV